MTLERGLSIAVGALSLAIVLTLLTTHAAPNGVGPDREAAAYMVELVNEVRVEEGLAPLRAAEDIAEVAERWSATMAERRDMRHNPRFGEEICCWQVATENVAWSEPHRVGRPGDPVLRITDEPPAALLDSPGHRANLLDPGVDEVGIGVHVDRDGNVWITQNFRRSRGTAEAATG